MANEEIEVTKEEKFECKCEFCKATKKVLTIALGTFIGFYCAMSLFFALHKPPMMHHGHFFKKHHQGIERNFEHKGKFMGEKPFGPNQMPVKPEKFQ